MAVLLNQMRQMLIRVTMWLSVTLKSTSEALEEMNRVKADKTNFTGATSSKAGSQGLVPPPAKGETAKFLCSDGTWQVPPSITIEEVSDGIVFKNQNGTQICKIPVM